MVLDIEVMPLSVVGGFVLLRLTVLVRHFSKSA